MKLYLAYGANTNTENMAARCPKAVYVCNIALSNHRLVLRGVADVVPTRNSKVHVAVWIITPECEAALDKLEGFPRLYVKRYITTHLLGRRHRAMFYVMRNARYESEPSMSYEHCLRTGYAQCGLPIEQLDTAIRRAKAWKLSHPGTTAGYIGSWASKPAAAGEFKSRPVDVDSDEAAADAFMMDYLSKGGN